MRLLEWLRLPEAKEIQNLDDPRTILLHGTIIRKKPFLRKLYLDFYRIFEERVPDLRRGRCVEIGSGGGFIKEVFPEVITSDLFESRGIDRSFSAAQMPFEDGSIDAFLMIDVFHHVPETRRFLGELARCLKEEGKVVMIEPANTSWGRFLYRHFHHEDFDPRADWGLANQGRLSSGNGALPWIVFRRDEARTRKEFPALEVKEMKPFLPFRYLLSGGVSIRQLVPSWTYPFIKGIEWLLTPLNGWLGMFYIIEIEKRPQSRTFSS